MKIIKRAIKVFKRDGLKNALARIVDLFVLFIYKIYARIEDFRIGKISVDRKKPSRYKELGAYATQSTNYIWLKKIFKSYPLSKDDVFIDVGCGEGRVLTYLYLKKFRNKMIGIELDRQIAQIAQQRTYKCPNIQIFQGNVLEKGELFKDATAIYLYNPFDDKVLLSFVEMIEKYVNHPLTMYYANDIHRKILDKREKWYIARRDKIQIKVGPSRTYTVYRYRPDRVK